MSSAKTRLDVALTARGLFETRTLAQDAIKGGYVKVNGTTVVKSSYVLKEEDTIEVLHRELQFASRAGFKLYGALVDFGIDLNGRIIADIGASTGGFSDVCLKEGAKHVYAIDVGSNQLLPRLIDDPRITNLEQVNCRYLDRSYFTEFPDFACVDVSFISLKLILPALLSVLCGEQEMLLLVKPQFEAGKADIGKNGIVKNKKVHIRILREMMAFIQSLGLSVQHLDISSIAGRDGNREYVLHVSKRCAQHDFDLKQIVEKKIENRW